MQAGNKRLPFLLDLWRTPSSYTLPDLSGQHQGQAGMSFNLEAAGLLKAAELRRLE